MYIAKDKLTGELVHSLSLSKDSRSEWIRRDFVCVCHALPCHIKMGSVRVWHFAHTSAAGSYPREGAGRGHGGGETLNHLATKAWIRDNIKRIRILRRCKCGDRTAVFDGGAALFRNCSCKCEQSVDKYVVDVAVTVEGEVDSIIEVRHTHRSTEEKVKALTEKYPHKVFEVSALDWSNNAISSPDEVQAEFVDLLEMHR